MSKRHDYALYGKLSATSAITSKLSSATAIYAKQAPLGATMPYIVFGVQAGGRDNRFAGDHDDVYYTVKAVADAAANGALVAEQIADAIEDALHESTLTLEGGWTNRHTQVMTDISYTETYNEKTYIHAGRVIRLRSDA